MSVDRRKFIKGVAAGAAAVGLAGVAGTYFFAGQEKGPGTKVDEKTGMRTRTLGRTGLDVSVITYGCGGLHDGTVRLLEAGVDRGINILDTGWGYLEGESERTIGRFLSRRQDREKLILLTKTSGFQPRDTAKATYEALKAEVQKDLRERLKTDYIDILMSPHGAYSRESVRNRYEHEALTKLKEDDQLIRFTGASGHTNFAEAFEAAIEDGFYDVLMTVMNVTTQNAGRARFAPPRGDGGRGRRPPVKPIDTTRMMQLTREKNAGLIVMKAANPGFLCSNVDELLEGHFPKDSKLSRHQKLYAYALAQPGTSSVTVGIGALNHLKEAIALGTSI